MTIIIFMILGCIFSLSSLGLEMLGILISIMLILVILLKGNLGCSMGMIGSESMIDMISFLMILLTLYLGNMMLLSDKKIDSLNFKFLVFSLILVLVYVFLSSNMLMFYLFFELVLIPMILLIYIYGYQPERLESGIYMLMYTIFGSLPMLVGLSFMWEGSKSLIFYFLMSMKLEMNFENWSWLIMLGFLVKLPMYGLHIWLPKAHVEASVSGSSILAGVLLKLGCYGFYRFYIFIFFSKMLSSFFMIMGLWGGLMSAMMCFYQSDMKKFIAYSSIVHMGLFLGGVIPSGSLGMLGGLFLMLGHGFCSSGLFYFVNLLYKQMLSRNLLLAKGFLGFNSKSMYWIFMLVILNMATPPFLNFFGEISLSIGVLNYDFMLSIFLFFFFFSELVMEFIFIQ